MPEKSSSDEVINTGLTDFEKNTKLLSEGVSQLSEATVAIKELVGLIKNDNVVSEKPSTVKTSINKKSRSRPNIKMARPTTHIVQPQMITVMDQMLKSYFKTDLLSGKDMSQMSDDDLIIFLRHLQSEKALMEVIL